MNRQLLAKRLTAVIFTSCIIFFTLITAITQSAQTQAQSLSTDADNKPTFSFSQGVSDTLHYLPIIFRNDSLMPPTINSFTASAATINQGESVTLTWDVADAITLTISPAVGDVSGLTEVQVSPSETTTYTLSASNNDGDDTAQTVVTVIQPPNITSFDATPSTIFAGEMLSLSWTVENTPQTVTISPNVGDVTGLSSVEISPTESTTYTLTATNSAGTDNRQVSVTVDDAPPTELLVFNWNKKVKESHHGFPWDNPPMASANGDWTQPSNFAEGVLYFRVEIFSQPEPQNMKLQFCFWQYNNTLENCARTNNVQGNPGTVVTWSEAVQDMWMKNGQSIDWENPRDKNGVAIKNQNGDPVSDYSDFDWSGEDPALWYPLDMHFMTVVVAAGETFSGWENYLP